MWAVSPREMRPSEHGILPGGLRARTAARPRSILPTECGSCDCRLHDREILNRKLRSRLGNFAITARCFVRLAPGAS
jgi:hypothetical protein